MLILFGRYIGSVTEPGFWWCNPFAKTRTVSLRVRNFQSERLKVNDAAGNPIEIAAVVVWCVADTAKAVFDVDDYEQFVTVQSETALRELAGATPTTIPPRPPRSRSRSAATPTRSTRASRSSFRVASASPGSRSSKRASLVSPTPPRSRRSCSAARRPRPSSPPAVRLVRGVVGLVQTAVGELAESDLIELDPERKAAMMSSLMVVLSGDRTPTAVINTGSLYT